MTGDAARAAMKPGRNVTVTLVSTGRPLPLATVIEHWPRHGVILGIHPQLCLVPYDDIQEVA